MDKTDDFIANRIIWKAEKYNLPTSSSFFYNDLPADTQQHMKTYDSDANCGRPVLFFTKATNEWTVVCTRQIICNDGKQIFKINLQDIREFRPTMLDKASKNKFVDTRTINKSEWHQVTVVDKENNSYVLHANKGSDLFALWNILIMVVKLYQ